VLRVGFRGVPRIVPHHQQARFNEGRAVLQSRGRKQRFDEPRSTVSAPADKMSGAWLIATPS